MAFAYSVPIVHQSPPASAITIGERKVELPKDSHLVIRQQLDGPDPRGLATEASLRVAEIAGMFDIRYTGVLSPKIYEGIINDGRSTILMLEGPIRLSAQPVREPSELAAAIDEDLQAVSSQPRDRRDRFRLAARWYRRGLDTLNQIDKFLSWWTVLEIFPGEGDDVVKKTTDLISNLYSDISDGDVKARLQIGRLAGARGDIVHQGQAFVRNENEQIFSDNLDRLEAMVITALRILGGIAPGDECDKYVRPSEAT